MIRAVTPKVLGAAAVGTAAAISHGSSVQADFQPSLAGQEIYFPQRSNVSKLLSASCEDWDMVRSAESSGFSRKPSNTEASEAAAEVFEVLGRVSVSSSHSWPDADASMAVSEEAIIAANQVLSHSPTHSGTLVSPHFNQVMQLVQNRPHQTKALVASLAADEKVWKAVTENPDFLSFLREVAPEAQQPDCKEDKVDESQNVDGGSDGIQSFIQTFMQSFLSSFHSFAEKFSDFVKKLFGNGAKEEAGPESVVLYGGIALLLFIVVGVIFGKRVI